MSSKFIHGIAGVRMSFFFKAEYYSIVCIYHFLVSHLSIDEYLGCFYILAIVNNVAVNMGIEYILRSLLSLLWGIHPEAESWNHMVITCLIFLMNCHTVFYSTYIVL